MHTVELLPDEGLDSAVRKQWGLLLDAGLPSLASHGHPTNRPHLTVVTAASLDGLPALSLPVAVSFGAARMLGRALVLPVEVTDQLREMHERVWSALPSAWPPPAEWVPHVSLALRASPAALTAASSFGRVEGSFVAARSYDTSVRTVIAL
ncbi:2'-5' RNA ligase family protein [Actinoplanes sp. LDG1-06]|uniref:2'-5' RNA ligase family protein n=1 Tax=Paractinoplanes ovalisporus TaxID=2810368 RepID=A0ABS2AIF7_9ACTN|nr:2'-5' RNA ligase family protein [Actinoplanes ovalisporus]MBM2619600.1 2'-5' RNA ligase family protein [Actinoplanes ovalisporus]